MPLRSLIPYWKHLRVPYSLTLAPLFLWGYFLADPRGHRLLPIAFVSFHFFLLSGITAYNSAYDRDEGPVGGMLRPPRVPAHLLGFSIGVQILGALLAALVGPLFLGIYLLIAALGVAYSHPKIRWKANPVASSLVVAIGQGGLGAFAGWVAAEGSFKDELRLGLGCAAAAMTTLGLYPMSQVFQIEEDAARGDRTLSVVLGPVGALRFGIGALAVAGILTITLMALRYSHLDVALIAGAYLFAIWQVARFARTYLRGEATVTRAFWTATRLSWITSGAFLLFIVGHLARLL